MRGQPRCVCPPTSTRSAGGRTAPCIAFPWGDIPADAVDDVLLNIDFTGDHADVLLDGVLIADWYTTGQPWSLALKRHAYPHTLELRVYPVTKPTCFDIPTPEGMALNAVRARARYRIAL